MELHHANPYHIPPPPEHHQVVTHYQTLGNQAVLGGSTKSSPAISVNTEFSRDSGFASQDHDFEQRDNQPIYEVTYRHFSSDFSFQNECFLPIYYERIVFIILRFIILKAEIGRNCPDGPSRRSFFGNSKGNSIDDLRLENTENPKNLNVRKLF